MEFMIGGLIAIIMGVQTIDADYHKKRRDPMSSPAKVSAIPEIEAPEAEAPAKRRLGFIAGLGITLVAIGAILFCIGLFKYTMQTEIAPLGAQSTAVAVSEVEETISEIKVPHS